MSLTVVALSLLAFAFVALVVAVVLRPGLLPPGNPLDAVVDVLRRRPWVRRGLSGFTVLMVLVAAGLFSYPFWTDVYQERLQVRLERQLASPSLERAYRTGRIETGDSLTRLKIPAIGVDVVVVEGTTLSALRAGAGHYPATALPCADGNVGIAGHRTTYGRPFNHLDELHEGDVVILETPIGKCTYRMKGKPFVVEPNASYVVAPTEISQLTLTTCHPKGSARERLIVQADRVSSTIGGA